MGTRWLWELGFLFSLKLDEYKPPFLEDPRVFIFNPNLISHVSDLSYLALFLLLYVQSVRDADYSTLFWSNQLDLRVSNQLCNPYLRTRYLTWW